MVTNNQNRRSCNGYSKMPTFWSAIQAHRVLSAVPSSNCAGVNAVGIVRQMIMEKEMVPRGREQEVAGWEGL